MIQRFFNAALLLMLAGVQTIFAQEMIVTFSDGQVIKHNVLNIEHVTFDEAPMYETVDLGLPSGTLWATCNIGANSPEEYGDYFSWAETLSKSRYGYGHFLETYKFYNGTETSLSKYWMSNENGTVDGLAEILPEDDAATANWGSSWQIPSREQFEELLNDSYTYQSFARMKGVKGMMIISRADRSNSIFLPAAGYYYDSYQKLSEEGRYWTRNLAYEVSSFAASCLTFNTSQRNVTYWGRVLGFSIRPVLTEDAVKRYVKKIVLSDTSVMLAEGETYALTATVYPSDAANPAVTWTSSDPSVARVSNSGVVTAKATGICSITCSAQDGGGANASCIVRVGDGTQGTANGHVFIDLGLPSGTLWATCNIGANSEEENGSYFAWGETKTKSDYRWNTYVYGSSQINKFTKYCTRSMYGYEDFTDDLTELLPEDDAATVNWGNTWQTPSFEQFAELVDTNYVNLTFVSPTPGLLVESKINGGSIFFPGTTGYYSTTALTNENQMGYYWSRSLSTSPRLAQHLRIDADINNVSILDHQRIYGLAVRPVIAQETPYEWLIQNLELSLTELELELDATKKLTTIIVPSYAKNTTMTWESSNENVARVSSSGTVTAVGEGTCTITCCTTDGSNLSATCQVTVISTHEYVDLALPSGTLWATCNIGAENPEDSGDYFAWGETEPKSEFSWDNYQLGKGNQAGDMTKYNATDEMVELLPEDDAATVIWGSDWQTPSKEQFDELLNENNTTIQKTTQNGISGRTITSNVNNNSIFLPNSGYYGFDGNNTIGKKSCYWARTRQASYANMAHSMLSQESNIISSYSYRFCGESIRPVRKK